MKLWFFVLLTLTLLKGCSTHEHRVVTSTTPIGGITR